MKMARPEVDFHKPLISKVDFCN